MKIATAWLKHLKVKTEQEEFLNTALLTAIPAFNRLQDIIKDEIRQVKVISGSREAYKNPNWSCFQADALGELRAYERVLQLITLEEK